VSVAEQAEVELANRNGRLHPSQRGKILDANFWVPAVLVVAGIVGLVALPIKAIVDARELSGFRSAFPKASASSTAGTVLPTIALMIPLLAVVAWFAFVCWRRLSEVRDGRLVMVTGWTHDFGKVHGKAPAKGQYPIYLYTIMQRIWFTYLVVYDREYRLDDRKLRERIQGERNNIVLTTPRSKILINVLPA
jgi:hypothetical protein